MCMEQEKQISRISRLIIVYLQGELSDAELSELSEWRKKSEKNERMFRRLVEGKWTATTYERHCLLQEVDDWAMIKKRIAVRRMRPLRRMLYYMSAACIVGLLVYGGWMLLQGKWNGNMEMPVMAEKMMPRSAKAVLELAGGKLVYLGDCEESVDRVLLKQYGIEESDSVLAYAGEVALEEWHTLRVPRGGEYILVLEDGSRVWANSETVLRYPVRFSGGERLVRLEGEAYFEVAKDAERPFCVETEKGKIYVLGTGFNVASYIEEEMTVTLAHGLVKVIAEDEETVLNPDEQAIVREKEGIKVRKVDAYKVCAWREGILYYDSMPLGVLAEKLERWFDCEFVFTSEDLKHLTFAGAFRRHENIDYILSILEATTNITMKVDGKKIIVSYK